MHSRHTIRSEMAKWRRNSWTEDLEEFCARRRKVVTTATTMPLPTSPMTNMNPYFAFCFRGLRICVTKAKFVQNKMKAEKRNITELDSVLCYIAFKWGWSTRMIRQLLSGRLSNLLTYIVTRRLRDRHSQTDRRRWWSTLEVVGSNQRFFFDLGKPNFLHRASKPRELVRQ